MSYNDKIDRALALVGEHNDVLGSESPHRIDGEQFIACIKASGGTNEKRLSDLSHENILDCMPAFNNNGVQVKPKLLAKEIAAAFREGKNAVEERQEQRPVTAKKADKMTVRELVEAFDPEDASNAVGQRLLVVCRTEPFVVYHNGRIVDVESTLKLLLEIKSGHSGRKDLEVAGNIKKVYHLGELPENYADENPIYHGRPLRPDGTCDQIGRSWEGVPNDVRQLIYLCVELGELKPSKEKANDILDLVIGSRESLAKLRQRYRAAAVRFDELTGIGDLPKLRIALGGSESNRPFPAGKQVVFGKQNKWTVTGTNESSAWTVDPTIPNAYVQTPKYRSGTYTQPQIRKPNQ